MSSRALHWLVLCFATLWFGVLVPVHNRGQIAVAGSAACAAAAANARCCHVPTQGPSGAPGVPDPAPRPAGACAVCFFIAGLDAPPPVTVIVTRLGFAESVSPAAPSVPAAVHVSLPFHSRAPPAA